MMMHTYGKQLPIFDNYLPLNSIKRNERKHREWLNISVGVSGRSAGWRFCNESAGIVELIENDESEPRRR